MHDAAFAKISIRKSCFCCKKVHHNNHSNALTRAFLMNNKLPQRLLIFTVKVMFTVLHRFKISRHWVWCPPLFSIELVSTFVIYFFLMEFCWSAVNRKFSNAVTCFNTKFFSVLSRLLFIFQLFIDVPGTWVFGPIIFWINSMTSTHKTINPNIQPAINPVFWPVESCFQNEARRKIIKIIKTNNNIFKM